jgi:hypothetical protein
VVAVRDAQLEGIEVLLLRGPGSTRCCFPGGRVRDADGTARAVARCYGVAPAMARKYFGRRGPDPSCLSLWVAATRELYVCTGLLSCTQGNSRAPVLPDVRYRLSAQRPLVEKRALDFVTLLESENVFCDLRCLVPFGKWLHGRGSDEARRTQIFLSIRSEEDRTWLANDAMGDWLTPEAAMIQWQRGQISLDFSTFACLRGLADFQSTESLLSEYQLESTG